MRPDTWLREPSFTKVRKKLSFWTREDFVNLAKHLFGTEDLDDRELGDLIVELKKPGVTPPGGLVARDPIVVVKPNPSNYTGIDKNRVYLSKGQVKIQFKSMATQLDWAYRLMVRTGMTWEKAQARWAEGMRISYFHEIWSEKRNLSGLMGLRDGDYILDEQLVRVLEKLSQQWRRITTPYPDHTPVRRAYNSLTTGSELIDPDGTVWVVAQTKQKLEGPQELLLELKA